MFDGSIGFFAAAKGKIAVAKRFPVDAIPELLRTSGLFSRTKQKITRSNPFLSLTKAIHALTN